MAAPERDFETNTDKYDEFYAALKAALKAGEFYKKAPDMNEAKDFKDSLAIAREYADRYGRTEKDYPTTESYLKEKLTPEQEKALFEFLKKSGWSLEELTD